MSIEKTTTANVIAAGTEPGTPETAKQGKGAGVWNVLSKIIGGAVGIMVPGAGPVVAGILGGKNAMLPTNFTGGMLGPEASQFLQYQQQMTSEMRAFELASTILKNRHDASMSAIRNMKS